MSPFGARCGSGATISPRQLRKLVALIGLRFTAKMDPVSRDLGTRSVAADIHPASPPTAGLRPGIAGYRLAVNIITLFQWIRFVFVAPADRRGESYPAAPIPPATENPLASPSLSLLN